MGEAKRRKQLLGEKYGKPEFSESRKPVFTDTLVTVNANLERLGIQDKTIKISGVKKHDLGELNTRGFSLLSDLLMKMQFGWETRDTYFAQAVREFASTNFFAELYGLYRTNPHPEKRPFDAARLVMFTALCSLVKANDSIEYADKSNSLIRKAGELVYEVDGDEGLEDGLIWSFIPDYFSRVVDLCFDGIGEWRA